jgi:hypothetical protein
MIAAKKQRGDAPQGVENADLSTGGSGFIERLNFHLGRLLDTAGETTDRESSLRWLAREYGDLQYVDGPFEIAVRKVAHERSSLGLLCQELTTIFECRDALMRAEPLLEKSRRSLAQVVLNRDRSPAERLQSLEGLVCNATEQTAPGRALALVVNALHSSLSAAGATLISDRSELSSDRERLQRRVQELMALYPMRNTTE